MSLNRLTLSEKWQKSNSKVCKSKNLNVHFDERLSNESGAEKCPKRDEEMATGYAGQIEEGVRHGREEQNAEEADPADHALHPQLRLVQHRLGFMLFYSDC